MCAELRRGKEKRSTPDFKRKCQKVKAIGYLMLGSGSKYSSWAEVTIVAMVSMLHLGLVLPKVLSVTPRHQSDTTGCFRTGRRLELCHAQQLKLH